MTELITTLGPRTLEHLEEGIILAHEHIYVDLRTPAERSTSASHAPVEDVVRLMSPELTRARDAGVAAIVVCTPEGVGRRVSAVRAVSHHAHVPVVVPTGIYREPWVPDWAYDATEKQLCDWMLNELEGAIAQTGVRAAWIKLSAGDEGMTSVVRKILRSAAAAGVETGAVIGSHTIRGRVVMDQLDTLEDAGYRPDRFIWIHTQAESDTALHDAVAARGAWIEYDAIGGEGQTDERFIELIHRMLDAGYDRQVLLSHDRGWYDPAKPGGGTPKPFTYMSEVFLPKLAASGVDAETLQRLTRENPFHAFAR